MASSVPELALPISWKVSDGSLCCAGPQEALGAEPQSELRAEPNGYFGLFGQVAFEPAVDDNGVPPVVQGHYFG